MNKIMITTLLTNLFFATTSFGASNLIECNSVTEKQASIVIDSDSIQDDRVYSNYLNIEISKMKTNDLNGSFDYASEQAIYIRDEGNAELPVVLVKLDKDADMYDAIKLVFNNETLTQADLYYYNLNSEMSILLASLKCSPITNQ